MGQALLPIDESGRYAFVYYGEICRLANRTTAISAGEILGYVIAHEIGHLLLGSHHQEGTVMQGEWGKAELQTMAKRHLRFNKAQRAEIGLEATAAK
jgi:hypothetical protein